MRKLLLLCLFFPVLAFSQVFTQEEIQQGYANRNDQTWFLFSEKLYGISKPQKVVLTGSFRSWSGDMNDSKYQLKPMKKDLWVLELSNPEFSNIGIRSEFKFRINEGEWLNPPENTPNEKGSNFVYMPNMIAPNLTAEMLSSGRIWVEFEGLSRPLSVDRYKLLDAENREIPIADVLPNESHSALLIPEDPIDYRRIYFVEAEGLRAWANFDGWFRETYSPKELGANVSKDGLETAFRLFAPRAEKVSLYLYDDKGDEAPSQELPMNRDEDGVWEMIIEQDISGTWYDFTIHGATDPGNHFFESVRVHISDPYARVSDDTWGRSMVAPRTKPATPLAEGRPPMQDVIAYEVHVQDFTDLLPVAEEMKGTLPAFFEPGLKNSKGQSIGFDYLVDLGINTVHLMPVQEFLHYPTEEWRNSFEDDEFMKEAGINTENYQWGYRTSHAFAVETRFRQKNTKAGAEREQFRDLVQAFHDKGMAVIIDIVPNHTAENMDDDRNDRRQYHFHWNVMDKLYYYRTKDLDHIGEYGNEVKFENRPMVQRWLIDQCKHWIEEFGIDGFRIDLAGQVDRQTLIKLREALGEDVIIYGEPWIGSRDPEFESNPSWDWYKHNSPITYFHDDSRNAFKGPTGTPYEKERDQGYAGGNFREKEKVKAALTKTFPTDKNALSGINYLDIHDNWALADRFAKNNWDGRYGVDEDRYKIAAVLLYTSLGPIVTHGGSEMMRSKGAGELKETVKEMNNGTRVYIHGKRDTYNMRIPNQFIWENVGKSNNSPADYDGMHKFWRGLNRFRMSETGASLRIVGPAPMGYYEWLDTENPYQLGYMIDGKILVLINTGSNEHGWKNIRIPEGNWKLVGNNQGFDHENGVQDKDHWLEKLEGNKSYDFEMDGKNFKVWIKN
ncbi:MAG: alpha-amylase family glycosyl hydrolase [Bacteroidia bacterium]|nr:alpha-amylase family glycosyl hydrolase [Bacteroidia bacterium]